MGVIGNGVGTTTPSFSKAANRLVAGRSPARLNPFIAVLSYCWYSLLPWAWAARSLGRFCPVITDLVVTQQDALSHPVGLVEVHDATLEAEVDEVMVRRIVSGLAGRQAPDLEVD